MPALPGLGDAPLQDMTLESLTSAVRYHAWLRDLAAPFLGEYPMEVGSGLGDYAAAFLAAGVPRMTLSDVEAVRLGALRARFADDARVDVVELNLARPLARQHSAVFAFNVLEHIEDDAGALRNAASMVRDDGAVIMLVPAFSFAMSDFDRKVGHMRRYTKRSLRRAFEEAGLEIEVLHYVNAPGLLAWFVGMRLLRQTPTDGLPVRLWDRLIVPVARALETRIRPPFGQSVFAVARRRSPAHA